MNVVNLLILLKIVSEATGLISRAITAGRDITDEELKAVFARADAADAKWAKANAKGDPP